MSANQITRAMRVCLDHLYDSVKNNRAGTIAESTIMRAHEDLVALDAAPALSTAERERAIRRVMRAPAFNVEKETPPPAPAQAGWTEEQLDAAWDFHLRTRGYTLDLRPTREMICGQLAEIAPLFAPKVRVKLPIPFGGTPFAYYEAVERALRAAGVEIEGEQ